MTAEMRLRAGGRTLPPPQSFLLGGMTAAVTFLQQSFGLMAGFLTAEKLEPNLAILSLFFCA